MSHTRDTQKAKNGSIWIVTKDDTTDRAWIPFEEHPVIVQMKAELEMVKNILQSLNMVGTNLAQKMGITQEKYPTQQVYHLINESHVIPQSKDTYGLEIVGGYINKACKINEVVYNELPKDIGNGCYKFEDGKIELDQAKYEQEVIL